MLYKRKTLLKYMRFVGLYYFWRKIMKTDASYTKLVSTDRVVSITNDIT